MDERHTAIETVRSRARAASAVVLDAGETVLRERPTMEHALLLLFLVVGIYMYQGASEFSPAAQTFPRLMAGGTAILSLLLLARNYLQVVAPVFGAALGAYLVYDSAITVVQDGQGLFQLFVGVGLLVTIVVFRTRFGDAVESFVAEPVQVMGDDSEPVPIADETQSEVDDAADPETGPEVDEAADPETESENDSSAMYVYEIDDPRGPVVTGLLCTGYMLLTFVIGMLYATPIFVAAWVLWVRMDRYKAIALTVLSFATAYLFYDLIQDDIAQGWLTGWELPPPDDLLGLSIHAVDALQWGVLLG